MHLIISIYIIFLCVYMRSDVFICVLYSFLFVYELGVACKPAAGAFVRQTNCVPGFFEHVNSGNCQNCVVLCVFYASRQILQI